MHRTLTALAATLAVALALAGLLASAAWSGRAAGKLTGTVGPGFTISLARGGTKVKTLPAGTYAITVSDRASIHSFVLEQTKGGHVQKTLTTVPFVGTKTVTVKLTPGSWTVFCKPHATIMFQDFTVA